MYQELCYKMIKKKQFMYRQRFSFCYVLLGMRTEEIMNLPANFMNLETKCYSPAVSIAEDGKQTVHVFHSQCKQLASRNRAPGLDREERVCAMAIPTFYTW